MIEDLEGRVARSGSSGLELADVERVSDDGVGCGFHDEAGEVCRFARQDRRDGRVDVEPGGSQLCYGAQAVWNGFAARLEDLADAVVIGSN